MKITVEERDKIIIRLLNDAIFWFSQGFNIRKEQDACIWGYITSCIMRLHIFDDGTIAFRTWEKPTKNQKEAQYILGKVEYGYNNRKDKE